MEHPFASVALGEPVQPSMLAHFWKVPTAPVTSNDISGWPGGLVVPPVYGTTVSAEPRKEISEIAREGRQGCAESTGRSIPLAATAAKISAS